MYNTAHITSSQNLRIWSIIVIICQNLEACHRLSGSFCRIFIIHLDCQIVNHTASQIWEMNEHIGILYLGQFMAFVLITSLGDGLSSESLKHSNVYTVRARTQKLWQIVLPIITTCMYFGYILHDWLKRYGHVMCGFKILVELAQGEFVINRATQSSSIRGTLRIPS